MSMQHTTGTCREVSYTLKLSMALEIETKNARSDNGLQNSESKSPDILWTEIGRPCSLNKSFKF